MLHDQSWRQVNYPFIRMNPVSRWIQIRLAKFVIAWTRLDVIMARSSGNLGLVRKYSEDIVRLETWLFNLQTRG